MCTPFHPTLMRFMSTSKGSQRMEFKAETKKLLDIVAKSIYTESEVFLRELLSNCSDALEKRKYKELKGDMPVSNEPLHVSITTNEKERTLTILDTGIGMTKDEIIKYLGTIAYSGSSKFIEELNKGGPKEQLDSLIGQFGVGFYSTFIVSEYVDVISKAANFPAIKWTSDGSGSYEVEEIADPGFAQGTKITLKLKPNFRQFSKERDIETIIKKYSLFISYPIKLNGDLLNNLQAIWYRTKKDVSNDEYQRFYEYITNAKMGYKYVLHYSSDVPLTIKALLYAPMAHNERLGMGHEPSQISLYSRKVLIKQNMSELLPKYLRFVKGVVDCEDIPLNLSRETYQGSMHIEKLKATLTKRILKLLHDEMKRDINSYTAWYKDFSIFLMEGLNIDRDNAPDILKLMRYQWSTAPGTISLDDYLEKIDKDQKCIYILLGPKRDLVMSSPYVEPFLTANVPVLFTEHNLDEVILANIGTYNGHQIVSVTTNFESILSELEKKFPEKFQKNKQEMIPEEDITPFCLWAKNEFGKKVSRVNASKRSSASPGIILGKVPTSMRQMMALFKEMESMVPENDMEIELNISHKLIKRINGLRKTNQPLASLLIKGLLDYLMVSAEIPVDFSALATRNLKMLENLSEIALSESNRVPLLDNKEKGRKPVLHDLKNLRTEEKTKKPTEFIVGPNGEAVPKK